MLYTERLTFVKEYINHWSEFDECSPIENGFTCWDCSAIFIEDGFNIHFGFYDPDGKKLAEYTLNTESGTAVMIYDERYAEDSNEYTGTLADILGGLLGSEEYFILMNKPIIIYKDGPEPMSIEDICKNIVSRICGEDNYPSEYEGRIIEE